MGITTSVGTMASGLNGHVRWNDRGRARVPATTRLRGWGGNLRADCDLVEPETPSEVRARLDRSGTIARGLGRSYGDAAINAAGQVLGMTRVDRYLGFDDRTPGRFGELTIETLTLAEIMNWLDDLKKTWLSGESRRHLLNLAATNGLPPLAIAGDVLLDPAPPPDAVIDATSDTTAPADSATDTPAPTDTEEPSTGHRRRLV
jgi:hypothetical protein